MRTRGLLALSTFFVSSLASHACEMCGGAKPSLFTEYTHGKSPGGVWDYVIVVTIAIGTFSTLPYALRCLLRPGERASTHIKNLIISQENHGD
ncbi:hypothetical protein K0B96_15325 [Horticoccus luteus]|uniref:Secreted protein n=1 Tax=Horticoccus luteus TaxID=2862869 RepID=A0A8F9XGV7_9BACT|nr:hypothetical protein [Horticoccus luteus]QYM78655.1 hypothetical protein K0B96_15325 [Horticoccus luteus]